MRWASSERARPTTLPSRTTTATAGDPLRSPLASRGSSGPTDRGVGAGEVTRPSSGGHRQHHVLNGEVLHLLVDLGGGLLGPAAEVDEQPDQQQPHVDEDAGDHHDDGEDASHLGGDRRRPPSVAVLFEHSAEHPAAVQGEGGQQVERGEQEVDPGQAGQQITPVEVGGPEVGAGQRGGQAEDQRECGAGGGSGGGDPQLDTRVLGELGHLGDATDRQEVDLGDDDPVTLGHEAVRQFVDDDAGEQGGQPADAGHESRTVGRGGSEGDEAQEEQERDVDPDVDARHRPQPERVAGPTSGRHGSLRGDEAVVAVVTEVEDVAPTRRGVGVEDERLAADGQVVLGLVEVEHRRRAGRRP